MVADTEKGLIVLTGGAHPGILTILNKINLNFPDKNFFAPGGFHLVDKEIGEIESTVKEFKERGIKKVGPTHYTGKTAVKLFKEEYEDNFVEVKTGKI